MWYLGRRCCVNGGDLMNQMPTLERVARAICSRAVDGDKKLMMYWRAYLPEAESAIAAYLVSEAITARRNRESQHDNRHS